MELAHAPSLIQWVPRSDSEVIEERKIKYVCDALTYKVLCNVKKQSLLWEWVQKRLREGRMYTVEACDKRPTSQWKVYKGVRDPSRIINHNLFRHVNLKDKASLREIIRDSTRGYAELF